MRSELSDKIKTGLTDSIDNFADFVDINKRKIIVGGVLLTTTIMGLRGLEEIGVIETTIYTKLFLRNLIPHATLTFTAASVAYEYGLKRNWAKEDCKKAAVYAAILVNLSIESYQAIVGSNGDLLADAIYDLAGYNAFEIMNYLTEEYRPRS
jgi:hypothetical protein